MRIDSTIQITRVQFHAQGDDAGAALALDHRVDLKQWIDERTHEQTSKAQGQWIAGTSQLWQQASVVKGSGYRVTHLTAAEHGEVEGRVSIWSVPNSPSGYCRRKSSVPRAT